MSNRSVKFAAALAASILAGANLTAMAQNTATTASTQTADTCLSAPKGTAPAGSHWFYHIDRGTKKQCWYLGDAKNKTAKTSTTQQQPAAVAPEAAAADATLPQSQPAPAPAMRKSTADALAQWPSSQAAAAPVASPDASPAGDPSASAAPDSANALSSDVNARWLDASSMAGTNGTRHAADQPAAVAQAHATPQQAVAPAPAAAAAASAEKSSSSTQMLLIVMVGALALAGLVSALVFRLPRTRMPPYQVNDEWRAPWDSLHTEPAPPISVSHERPLRLSQAPPRRAEMPVAHHETARDPDQTEHDNQQIAAMLQRLARSAAN